MVEQLSISNFKSIRQQQVKLGRMNVLIGQNGAGKSNFISVFSFLEELAKSELQDYIFRKGGLATFLYGGLERSKALSLLVRFSKELNAYNQYECQIGGNGSGDYYFWQEQVGYGSFREEKEKLLIDKVPANGRETGLLALAQQKKAAGYYFAPAYYADYILTYFHSVRVYHFHDTSDNARVKLPQDIFNAHYLQSEAENLAPFLYNLQQNHAVAYADIVAAVKLVYPAFADFFLRESPFAKGKMELLWREQGTDNLLSARQLSDGTLRFICLATLLLQPAELPDAPRTILLDEPELGLHPFALHVLAELLRKAAMHRQVIVATQSVGLLDYFTPEDLLIVERGPEGDTVFARKNSEQLASWLQEYSLGELWEANLLGGRP